MKLSFLESGIDSLTKGFNSLKKHEELLFLRQGTETERFFILKDAILFMHHGVEILLKFILFNKSEFLVFSQLDQNVKKAYCEMNQKKLNSIFQTSLSHKLHTVTFTEAIERITRICGVDISKELQEKLIQMDNYRNQVIHSEIHLDELAIVNLFKGFMDEIDFLFSATIKDDYKTLSGYSSLKENFLEYKEYLEKNDMCLKSKIIETFLNIFGKLNISMGLNEVKYIDDINMASKIVSELMAKNFKFGTDLYNGFCSGDVSAIKRLGESHFSLFTKDNDSEYIFKFKSMVIYLPEYDSDFSPIIFFEANEDIVEEELRNNAKKDYYDGYYLSGLFFIDEGRVTYDKDEINEFYNKVKYDDSFLVPSYYSVYRFITRTMLCFINFQQLSYGKLNSVITNIRSYEGKTLEVALRKSLVK